MVIKSELTAVLDRTSRFVADLKVIASDLSADDAEALLAAIASFHADLNELTERPDALVNPTDPNGSPTLP